MKTHHCLTIHHYSCTHVHRIPHRKKGCMNSQMSQNKGSNKKSIRSMVEEKKWVGGNIWWVNIICSLHLIPIFFHDHTKCTSKISEFKTFPASLHIQQQPTLSHQLSQSHVTVCNYQNLKCFTYRRKPMDTVDWWCSTNYLSGISFTQQINSYHIAHKLPSVKYKHLDLN
jgi:hypothetical protein